MKDALFNLMLNESAIKGVRAMIGFLCPFSFPPNDGYRLECKTYQNGKQVWRVEYGKPGGYEYLGIKSPGRIVQYGSVVGAEFATREEAIAFCKQHTAQMKAEEAARPVFTYEDIDIENDEDN